MNDFTEKMREAEQESHYGKRKEESKWKILKIHHQRSRFVWEKFKKKEISKEFLQYLIK